jgi:hypothetical protein
MHLENLIASVESSSEWRAGKAAQFPDDKRNQQSSDALAELTRRLRKLPADNEAARAYEAVVERLVELDETERLVGYESRYVGRYGFDCPADGDPDDFLSSPTRQYLEWLSEAEQGKPRPRNASGHTPLLAKPPTRKPKMTEARSYQPPTGATARPEAVKARFEVE